MEEVLYFINQFKSLHRLEIEDTFLNGYCYWFAYILKERFQGEIYYLPIQNHYITKINDLYYDITGNIKLNEKPYNWNEYKFLDELETQRLYHDCILKEK